MRLNPKSAVAFLLVTGVAILVGYGFEKPAPQAKSGTESKSGQSTAEKSPQDKEVSTGVAKSEAGKGKKGEPVPLNKEGTVLLDTEGKRLLLKTTVVLREGSLEMLCCLKQTKEHESILTLAARAYVVHAGLVALGAEPGKSAEFLPEFKPATGPRVDIFLQWKDDKEKVHRVPAQTWIRHAIHRFYAEKLDHFPRDAKLPEDSDLRYDEDEKELYWYGPMSQKQKEEFLALSKDPAYRRAIELIAKRGESRQMNAHWIFPGSGFDVIDGQEAYRAEGGDLICVANFATAMLDVSVQSGQGSEDLIFEAYTDRIPPRGTEVTVELIPVLKKRDEPAKKPAAGK